MARADGPRGTGLGVALALVVAAPALVGLAYTTLAALDVIGFGAGGPSLARPARVLADAAVWRGVLWTLWIAAASTAVAAGGAVAVAVAFRGTGRLDRFARAAAVVPLPVPHLVAAAVGLLLLAQSGILARLLAALGLVAAPADMPPLVYDRAGVGLVLTLAWKELPFLALLAASALAERGSALEETAAALGAGRLARFRLVTWPLLWRALLPGMVAVFVFSAGSYETAVLLAPSDPLALPLLTMEQYTDASLARRDDAFVLALVAFAIAIAAVVAHEWTRGRWERLDS